MQIAPTLYLGLRLPTAEYVYGDPEHPDRRTGVVHSPPYTREDRALLMALEAYEASLCQCGVPINVAWHSEMDGYWDADPVVCHVCTASAGREITYAANVRSTRNPEKPMPPFVPGVTVTEPTKSGPNP